MKKTAIIIFLFTITSISPNAENEILAVQRELPNETIEIAMVETIKNEISNNDETNDYEEIILDTVKEPEIKPIKSNRKTKEEIQEELNRIVRESMLTMTMRGTIYFGTGNNEGLLGIENSLSNSNNIQVEIHLHDSSELVYTSKILNAGESIEKDALDVTLEKGEYPAIATFKSLDVETNTVNGKGKINILLIVEE